MNKSLDDNCKKCGTPIEGGSLPIYTNNYCKKCFKEFKESIEDDSIIVEREKSSTWEGFRIYKKGKIYRIAEGMQKEKAIVIGRKIASEENSELLFEDDQKNTIWFMNNYLEENPELMEKVKSIEEDSTGPKA